MNRGTMPAYTRDTRGFTIAELLIAVAIIGVLVAVAIPVFNNQLEKSREATDLANVRSAYAEVMNAAILDDRNSELWLSDGVFQKSVSLVQKTLGWSMGSGQLVVGGISEADADRWRGEPRENGSCKVRWANGTVRLLWNGFDRIDDQSAPEFLDIDILKAIVGDNYAHSVINSNETYDQGGGTKAFIDYATEHGFDLADYDASTWQIYVRESSGDKGFLNDPAVYWSTIDIDGKDDMVGKTIPVMGYRNGQYDVWFADVVKYNSGTSNEYITIKNNFANVTNAGGSATFQLSSYEEAKAKYDEILAVYKSNTPLTNQVMSDHGL